VSAFIRESLRAHYMIKPSIAVVDDDELTRLSAVDLLRSLGLITKTFGSGEEFLQSNRVRLTSCLIVDAHMPKMGGLELFGRLLALGTPIPTILMIAHCDEQLQSRALSAGIAACLTKPFGAQQLVDSINAAGKQGAFALPVKAQ
jgi:FixJ family two-component response regulator